MVADPKSDIVDGPFGSNLKASEYVESGVPIIRLQNVERGQFVRKNLKFITPEKAEQLQRHAFAEDDIVITKLGAPLGKACLVPGHLPHGIVVADVVRARVNHGHVLRDYLVWAINSDIAIQQFEAQTKGTTRPRVNLSHIRGLELPLAPLPEQQRIVAEIETLFTRLEGGVSALKRAQANLRRYKASVLKAACEGRLVPTEAELARAEGRDYERADVLLERILAERRAKWEADQWEKEIDRAKKKAAQAKRRAAGLPARIRDLKDGEWQDLPEETYDKYLPKTDKWKRKYKGPEPPDTSDLPELPEGWEWAVVEQLGALGEQAVLTGPFGITLGRSDFVESGVPVLTIGCLTDQGLTIDKANFVSDEKAANLDRYRVSTGDLLFSRMATVGRADMVSPRFEGAIINYHLMRLRLAREAMEPTYFISYVRGSRSVVDYLNDINHGVTRPGINTKQLLGLPVALPPLAEQNRIVAEVERRLSVVAELEKQVEAALRRAERLRQAILKHAFEGKLVPQDPDDEPASVLFARIKAARSGQAG
jgi:type I restriction enzyme S subunit